MPMPLHGLITLHGVCESRQQERRLHPVNELDKNIHDKFDVGPAFKARVLRWSVKNQGFVVWTSKTRGSGVGLKNQGFVVWISKTRGFGVGLKNKGFWCGSQKPGVLVWVSKTRGSGVGLKN
jgi:hypothetical protein